MNRTIALPALVCLFLPGLTWAVSAGNESGGRLESVEDKIGRPAEYDPEAARREAEEYRRKMRQRRQERENQPPAPDETPTPIWTGDDGAEDFWDDITFIALAAPFAGPYYLLGDDFKKPVGFQPYPFANGADGYISENGKSWMVNADASFQLVSGNIVARRADATVNFWRRFAFEGSYSRYEERLKNSSAILSFGESLITFTFAANEIFDFRAGGGIQTIDGKNLNSGTKWVYRTRWFQNPWQFNLDFGVTTGLGASSLSEIAPGVSYHTGRLEYKLGYRRWKISGDRLAGPEFTVKVWF